MGRNRILKFIVQIIGWGIVFGFPLVFPRREFEVMTWTRYMGYVFVPIAFVFIFYSNYYFLINRVLFKRGLFQYLLINLGMFIFWGFFLEWWHNYHFINILGYQHDLNRPPRMMIVIRDFAMMALTAALSVAIRMTEIWDQFENEKKELERANTETELKVLRNQLNPHFLFNTLNNIYALITIDADRAQYAIHHLSALLRYVLYEDHQQLVSLQQELRFVRSYIELMSLRLSGQVDLRVEMPEEVPELKIPPLLFITLIENAFKHGVSSTAPSFIHIRLQVTEDRKLYARIENSNYPKTDSDRSGSGVGLLNLKKRLELLYPGEQHLKHGLQGSAYVAELNL